jgi:peptide/nickel transport system substrate-binding protein
MLLNNARSKLAFGFSVLVVLSLLLSACAPAVQPTPEVIEKEVIVTQEVPVERIVTQEVEVIREVVVTPTAVPEKAPTPGGTLIVARAGDMQGLDPHKQTAFTSFRVLEHIYDPLLALDKDMNVIPNLAESWEWSNGNKTLTMKLRQNVVFHNGDPMTSADVQASYQRLLDEATGAAARSFFTSIEKIDAPDVFNVVFTLSAPNAAILAAMTKPNSAILSKKLLDSGWDPASEAVGTGAFKLTRWEPDNVLILDKNPDFWIEGLPYLDSMDFRTLPDEASILAGLRAGTLDWAIINNPRVGIVASGSSDLVVSKATSLAYHVLQLNANRPVFQDLKVRQAISCAIDRQQVLDTASLGEGIVTGPATPPFYQVPQDELFCYQKDVEKAKALLAEAGNPEVKFTIIAATDEPPTAVAEAQNIQAQLAEIGVTVEIETLELGVYVDRWLKADFDAAAALNGGNPDPHNMFFRYWHSTGNLNSVANYQDPKIDQLLEQASSITDPNERKQIYAEVQALLTEAVPWVWLYTGYDYRAMQPYVRGFTPLSNGSTMYLREAWLDK